MEGACISLPRFGTHCSFDLPASSAAYERDFPTAGFVIQERRSQLKPGTVDDILFLHSNLKRHWVASLLQSGKDVDCNTALVCWLCCILMCQPWHLTHAMVATKKKKKYFLHFVYLFSCVDVYNGGLVLFLPECPPLGLYLFINPCYFALSQSTGQSL